MDQMDKVPEAVALSLFASEPLSACPSPARFCHGSLSFDPLTIKLVDECSRMPVAFMKIVSPILGEWAVS